MTFFSSVEGKILVDATAGGGGHLKLLAQAVSTHGHVFAFDKDPRAHKEDGALGIAKQFTTITLFHQPFSQIIDTLHVHGVEEIDGLLCDLGVSSNQLDDRNRGFSFLEDGPLDMRMNPHEGITAYEWLAKTSETNIADVLYNFSGERKSRKIARFIKESWPIENSTLALARLVVSALRQKKWTKIHPATRTFQAIRMAVNQEIPELQKILHGSAQALSGRWCCDIFIIS